MELVAKGDETGWCYAGVVWVVGGELGEGSWCSCCYICVSRCYCLGFGGNDKQPDMIG